MTREPDPDLVFGYLPPDERAVVARWLDLIETDADAWPAIPPLALFLPIIATLRAAADVGEERPDLSHGDRVRLGAELLGIEDDDGRATHPADSLLRTLRGWRRRGKIFRSSKYSAT